MSLGVPGIVKVYKEVPENTNVCKGVLRSLGQCLETKKCFGVPGSVRQ